MSSPLAADRRPVPWRTIFATIAAVGATYIGYKLFQHLSRVIIWIVIAGFFAIILSPPVNFLERRAHVRRSVATLLVFLAGIGAFAALMYAFINPLYREGQDFADNFPTYVEEAKAGEGPVGGIVKRYDLDQRIEDSQDDIQGFVDRLGKNSIPILASVGNAVAATLTILVLSFLMILQGPKLQEVWLNALSPPNRARVGAVASDCSRAVTGYMAGNLVISIIAGGASFLFLLALQVPFNGVLALWVAFADLIPLVGATLGAIPAVIVAFLDSPVKGFITIGFFVVYQQFENHVLQVTIMSRTVDLNPLTVLISVLVGVELFGILGALLAIPVAGIIQVIARDLYDERRGRIKPEPTVGEDEVPVSHLATDEATDDATTKEAGE